MTSLLGLQGSGEKYIKGKKSRKKVEGILREVRDERSKEMSV